MRNQTVDPLNAFVEAFNTRDLEALKALLTPEATAEVLGSNFGTEQGPEDIAAKSLTHMLGEQDHPLTVELFEHDGVRWLLFMTADDPPLLDSAAQVETEGKRIARIEYTVVWFRRRDLGELADARGVSLPPEGE